MKRETAMYRFFPGKKDEFISLVSGAEAYIQRACARLGAKNASAWSVNEFLYLYAEFEDGDPHGLKQLTDEFAGDMSACVQEIAAPGSMRLMYHDIGNVRADKSLIRRRVFATVLKDGCAEEYKARHQKLIDARGERVSDGPETNFTIRCACDRYIFGYCELVKSYDHEPSAEEKAATNAWETRQLEIMDWLTDDVDWITGERHEKMKNLFIQDGYR